MKISELKSGDVFRILPGQDVHHVIKVHGNHHRAELFNYEQYTFTVLSEISRKKGALIRITSIVCCCNISDSLFTFRVSGVWVSNGLPIIHYNVEKL